MARIGWRDIWQLLMPRICLRCGNRLRHDEHYLCASCLSLCPTVDETAPRMEQLATLLREELPLVRAGSLYQYGKQAEARRIVFELKYNGKPETGRWMGRLLADRLAGSGFFEGVDLLVPVPLHPRKQRRRGYNQAEWIALGVADRTGLPLRTDAVRRTVFTHTQTHLDPLHRRRNVGHVFQPGNLEGLEGKHLLLIDDVITTGATITACAKALEAVKGIRVSVLSFAYAGPHH